MSGVVLGMSIQFGQETNLPFSTMLGYMAVIKTGSMRGDRFGPQLKDPKGPYFGIFIP